MPEWLQDALPQTGEFEWAPLLVRLILAMLLGGAVAGIYRWTQRPEAPVAPSFIATLVLLCILIAMVTQVIGGNIARAFSLVGALSIIRFRTVVEDTRDTAFVIFAVVVGMALGAGNLTIALIGLGVVGLAAFLLRWLPLPAFRASDEWTLVFRFGAGFVSDAPWEGFLGKYCQQAQLVSAATSRQGAALDFVYRIKLKPATTPQLLIAEFNRLEGMQNLELRRT